MLSSRIFAVAIACLTALHTTICAPVLDLTARTPTELLAKKGYPVLGTKYILSYNLPSPFPRGSKFPGPMYIIVALRDFVNYKLKPHRPATDPFPWHEDYDENEEGGVHIDLYDQGAATHQPSVLNYQTAGAVLAAAADGYVDLELDGPQRFQVTAAGALVAYGNILNREEAASPQVVAPPIVNAADDAVTLVPPLDVFSNSSWNIVPGKQALAASGEGLTTPSYRLVGSTKKETLTT